MDARVRVKNIGLSSGFHKTNKPEQTAISVCPVPVHLFLMPFQVQLRIVPVPVLRGRVVPLQRTSH